MGLHRGARCIRITGQDRHHDGLVLLVGVCNVAAQQWNLVQQCVQSHPVLGHQRHQGCGSGGLGDRQV
jgi:hypothetical protein